MAEQEWAEYLAMLELENPALAAALQDAIGGLTGAVPPAGEYTTGMDYQTLSTALSMEYVGEVIRQYEATLGPAPELYAAAVANGWLTPEAAEGLQAEGFTEMGALQQKFASQGGLRALAGPYQAARIELLGKAMADMEAAAQKASADAYTLAQQTTQLRIQALTNAGQLGIGALNAGVSRRNAMGMEGPPEPPGENPPLELPAPPQPQRPPWWEGLLAGLAPIGLAGAMRWAGEPKSKTPEEAAAERLRFEEALAQGRDPFKYDAPAREIVNRIGPVGGDASPTMMSGFGTEPQSSGMGGGAGGVSVNPFQLPMSSPTQYGTIQPPQSFGYQSQSYDMNPFSGSAYGGYQSQPSYDYAFSDYQAPSYQYQQPSYNFDWGDYYDYSGGGGGYDYYPSYDDYGSYAY